MANKELTFWCKLKSGPAKIIIRNEAFISEDEVITYEGSVITEIIWHPVMIGCIIKRIKENREMFYWEYLVKLLGQLSQPWLWRELSLSIDDQSDECIDYIYSLIEK